VETMGRQLGATVVDARSWAHSGGPADGRKADTSVYVFGRHLEPTDRTGLKGSWSETMAVAVEVHAECRQGLGRESPVCSEC
jgi:hypothetical protein